MKHSLSNILAYLCIDRPGSTDAELVAAFVTARDEAAFAALVRRHGPMVLAACRRILYPDTHAAEDAFQAAFLVLATKADTVQPPGRVGAWLHGVAVHVAQRAKAWMQRLSTTDPANLEGLAEAASSADGTALREVIDSVLLTLPEKYRAPVVLCDLEGRSRANAATALGWTEGTLSGRLARARRLLADRLARRGYAPALVVPALAVASEPAQAVPPHLVAAVVRTAGLVAAGCPASVSARVIALTREDATVWGFAFKAAAAGLILAGGVTLFSLLAANPPTAPATPQAGQAKAAQATEPGPAPSNRATAASWVEGPSFANLGRVTALAFGPNVVAVGDDQAHLVLWDAKTGKKVETLKMGTDGGVQETIDGLAIARDGKQFYLILNRGGAMHQASLQQMGRIYSGFGDSGTWVHYGATGDSRYWLAREAAGQDLLLLKNNSAAGKFEMTVAARFPHPDKVTHAAGDADVVVSVAGNDQVTLRRWVQGREQPLWQVDLDGADVSGVVVAPGGKRVAVTGAGGLVRVFDGATGKLVAKANGYQGPISPAAFNQDGSWFVVGRRDGSARVLDTESGQELAVLKGHSDRVQAVAVSADGAIATGGADKRVQLWAQRK